jgi:hypothetical protein
MTNTTACIDGYVHGWNHVCNQKQAKGLTMNFLALRHSNVKQSMIHYLQKSRTVLSVYFRRLINVLLMYLAYVVQRELPNLYRAVNYCSKCEFGIKSKEKTCERCGREVQPMNDFFFRCPYCALLKKMDGATIEW